MATEADKVNTGALATILTVGALAMLGISAAVTALVRYEANATTVAKGGMASVRALVDLEKTQTVELNQPVRWTDRNKALVGMPLDRAMKQVVDDLQRDPNTATPPPPEPKEKKVEELQPSEEELGVAVPTDDERAAEGAAEPGAPAPAEGAAEGDAAAKAKKKPAAQAPGAAPDPAAPQTPPATPAPAPESAPQNAP